MSSSSRGNPRNWTLARRLFPFLTAIQTLLVFSAWGRWPVVGALTGLFFFRVGATALLIAGPLRRRDSLPALRLLLLLNLVVTTVEAHLSSGSCWRGSTCSSSRPASMASRSARG